MDVKHEEELRTDFKNFLYNISQSQNILQDASGKKKRSGFYQELERLYYIEGFQHFTSDIFIVLKNIRQDSSKGSIDILGQNLEWLRRKYQKKKDSNGEAKDIESNIQKLYDDVNLEISRILTDEADARNYSHERKINQLDRKIEESQNKLAKVEKKIESSQKEYITILGIFAAVILAFTGGITFSTSVLENLHKSSIYRVTLVVLLIGFTLVNIIYLLFMFIDKLVRNDKRVIPISPLITFDISVIAFVIIVIVLWSTGFVESRNERINTEVSGSESFISETIQNSKESEKPFKYDCSH